MEIYKKGMTYLVNGIAKFCIKWASLAVQMQLLLTTEVVA